MDYNPKGRGGDRGVLYNPLFEVSNDLRYDNKQSVGLNKGLIMGQKVPKGNKLVQIVLSYALSLQTNIALEISQILREA